MLSPDLLRAFLAVHRHLSYTRAAVELHLSQPAVWRQVRALEKELGVRLVEQIGKTLHLTDAGHALVPEAERLLAHVGRVRETVRLHVRGVRGQLRIGASTTPGYYLLPEALGRFHEQHPDVDLAYDIENSARIERRLLRNELDLGFVGGTLRSDELETRELVLDQIVCYTARVNRLASRERLGPSELAGATCVVREEGSATRRMFESWLAATGHRLERTIVVRCPEVAKALVSAGIGYSFISRLGLAEATPLGACVPLEVIDLDLRRSISVAWQRGRRLSRPVERFLELCGMRAS